VPERTTGVSLGWKSFADVTMFPSWSNLLCTQCRQR